MFPSVVTKDPAAVEEAVRAAYLGMFPDGDPQFVRRVFSWAEECFSGRYRDYLAIDAVYHDFEHTMQGTLCLIRLMEGLRNSGEHPQPGRQLVELGLLAVLLHDTGYLKHQEDTTGTGAKYTVTHVARSADFAEELLKDKGFGGADIRAVRNMISCTGGNANLDLIRFQDARERLMGCALATADILGQMAAGDYVEKLPILFREFTEAAAFSKAPAHFVASFASATDLMRRTPEFWATVVWPKLEHDLLGLHRCLRRPFPDGPNEYLDRIRANLDLLSSKTN